MPRRSSENAARWPGQTGRLWASDGSGALDGFGCLVLGLVKVETSYQHPPRGLVVKYLKAFKKHPLEGLGIGV